ncbi:MAG: GGDEF domain-containing protein [Bilophila wadsworthia]
MAECKQAVLVEKETAHRDCLTGCYDRMTIRHLVDLCFLKSDVRQSHAMFVIDVDNFKRVNDTWGREFGDIVLNDVAAVLRRIFRRSDYIGRIGDDEFLVLLRDVEPERLSEKKAQEFYTALGTLFSARGDERYKPTCSVGIARYPMDGTLFETVFQECRRRTA